MRAMSWNFQIAQWMNLMMNSMMITINFIILIEDVHKIIKSRKKKSTK